ncbi:hypothetical protein M2146_001556 [Lachnospiraceae bacterium PF1-22]|uniref:DUF6612 family protein n=1 Tax=Ohessyouella blattaphilus TaxID=2949333 RepID=UPI003E31802A
MKRGIRRIGALALVAVMIPGLITGCKKKATPENLFTDLVESSKTIESYVGSTVLDMQFEHPEEGVASISMTLDTEVVMEPYVSKSEAEISMKFGGTTEGQELEMYQEEKDGELLSYIGVDDYWEVNSGETSTISMNEDSYKTLVANADKFTTDKETIEVSGKECFRLKGTLSGKDFYKMVDEDMLEEFTSGLFDTDELEKLEFPIMVDIYRKEVLPARFSFDMSSVFESLDEFKDEDVKINACLIEMTFTDYNTVDKIEIPKAALETSGDSDWEDDGDDYYERDITKTDLKKSDKLSDDWTEFNVQVGEEVLKLPVSIAEFEKLGYVYDEEYTSSDTMVEADDIDFVWVENEEGNSISLTVYNDTNEALNVKECKVYGVSISDYGIGGESIEVLFAGGITIGSTIEEVKKAYGDEDDLYEGDSLKSYTWEKDVDNAYYSVSVDVDIKTGVVFDISYDQYIYNW